MLTDLIEKYHEAKAAWHAKFDEDEDQASSCPEWDAYEAAEDAVLNFPCQTLADVQIKAAFILVDESAHDSLRNCYRIVDGELQCSLTLFLHSLLGEGAGAPVEKSNNGEN